MVPMACSMEIRDKVVQAHLMSLNRRETEKLFSSVVKPKDFLILINGNYCFPSLVKDG